jgi:hypothetical protein
MPAISLAMAAFFAASSRPARVLELNLLGED